MATHEGVEERLPTIWYRFRDLTEVFEAVHFDAAGATFTLRVALFAPVSGPALVRFRIGAGRLHAAVGQAAGEGGTLRVRFEGPAAKVVRDAVHPVMYPMQPRAYVRYPCSMPVLVELAPGKVLHAVAGDVGLGGAGLRSLSGYLGAGSRVNVYFEPGLPIPAQVIWFLPAHSEATAGVEFAKDPATISRVKRLVNALVSGRSGTSSASPTGSAPSPGRRPGPPG